MANLLVESFRASVCSESVSQLSLSESLKSEKSS